MKVLMVCLGNICRSPIAEGILRDKAKARGLNIETDSAGTAAYHIGNPPDARMILMGSKNGYDIADLRARQFKASDFQYFDHIFAMDQSNYKNIISLASSQNDEMKVKLMLNEIQPETNAEVPDPYYGGDQGFQHVIDLLEEAIESFLNRIDA